MNWSASRRNLRAAPPSRHAARFLSLAQDIGLAPGRAYEVGCASGEMLNQFRRAAGRSAAATPRLPRSAQAKDDLRHRGRSGRRGRRHPAPAGSGPDPGLPCAGASLRSRRRACAVSCRAGPGGHLLLEVPCATAPEALPPGWFTFEHLHYYRPAILARLLREAGFELVETRIAMRAENYPVIAIAARKAQQPCRPPPPIPMPRLPLAATMRRATLCCGPEPTNGWPPAPGRSSSMARASIPPSSWRIPGSSAAIRCWQWSTATQKNGARPWRAFRSSVPKQLIEDPRDAAVIVSSYYSEKTIARALVEKGIAPSRIVTLYSGTSA